MFPIFYHSSFPPSPAVSAGYFFALGEGRSPRKIHIELQSTEKLQGMKFLAASHVSLNSAQRQATSSGHPATAATNLKADIDEQASRAGVACSWVAEAE